MRAWRRFKKKSNYCLPSAFEHISTVGGGIVTLGYAGLNFYKAHHLFKLTHCAPGTEQYKHHFYRARATPQQIETASYWISRFRFTGLAALGAPLLFIVYLGSKRKLYKPDE